MKIFLCYGYRPYTTGVYFEKALKEKHDVYYIGPSWGDRSGYSSNEDLAFLVEKKFFPEPDLVFFIEPGINFFPRGLEKMPCPTVCYLIDAHRDFKVRRCYAPFFDYIFVAQKESVKSFKRLGYNNAYWLPLACDPDIHAKRKMETIYDIGFVGQISKGSKREKFLRILSRKYKMNDFEKFYPKEKISAVYSQSKIAFNCSLKNDLNMRVFEAMGSGSLLITNSIQNGQLDLFETGKHFIEYADEASLLKKVEFYLIHEKERKGIGEAGRLLTISKHTYQHRCQQMLDTIFGSETKAVSARIRKMSFAGIRSAYGEVYAGLRLVDPVIEEFKLAWEAKAGRRVTIKKVLKALVMKFNAILRFTRAFRRFMGA